jgi:hypothetical protein
MSALRDADIKATHALNTARDAGISVAADGDDLVLTAAAPPAPATIEFLSQCKTEILGRLRREVALDALREVMTEPGKDAADGTCAVREEIWFARWVLRTRSGYRSGQSCEAAFQRTRDDLIAANRIARSNGYVWAFF